MEKALKSGLKTNLLSAFGKSAGGGCISQGQAYETDTGPVFVKINDKAQILFKAWRTSSRSSSLQPKTWGKIKERRKQSCLLYLTGAGLFAGLTEPRYVDKFGFHTVTCCGYISQVNEWQSDWPTFFVRHRLQAQMDLIERDYGDREARELWTQLKPKIPEMFCDLEIIPALIHGDLWAGNVAEDDSGPILFDPACFYGHSEFELAISMMFGGFSSSFFSAYHNKIPKAPGFEKRNKLYQLFNFINHWNHFGTQYRRSTLNVMRKLVK
ncbi:fructosamine-3-kinase isoform X3 [Anolis carolinensis]|uniref:fructosamine-3-kinase isoform X3 n=1 Tax=Anolis carolinensis TaxID=28377 RepID=UPI002F2B1704